MTASIKRNLFWNILLNVSAVLFPLVTAPYVARVLLPENLGLFNFANTYAGYFAMMAALGIPTYGVREIAKCRDDKTALGRLLNELFSLNVYSTFAVSLLYIATLFAIGRMHKEFFFFLLAGVVVYTRPFGIEWYFQGLENFGFVTLRTLAVRMASIVGLFIFVRDAGDVLWYMLLNVLGTIAGQIWNCVALVRSGMRLQLVLHGLRRHLKPVLILFASALAVSIYTVLDTVMLGFLADYPQVAYYQQATQISKLVLMVVTSLAIVAMPRISYYAKKCAWDELEALLRKSFGIIALLAIPAAFGMAIVAPAFVPWFFGDAFLCAVVPLQVMAFVIVSIGFNSLFGVQILLGLGLDKLFLASVLLGTVVNFALNWLMIPLWGAIGAAVASVAAETLILAVEIVFVRCCTSLRIHALGDIGKSLMGVLAFFPLAWGLKGRFGGGPFLAMFVPLCLLVYFAFEQLLRHQSLLQFEDMVFERIRKIWHERNH